MFVCAVNARHFKMSSAHPLTPVMQLLEGFRMGEMEIHIESCEVSDLVKMLPVTCSSICMLQFGMTKFRTRLINILGAVMCIMLYL